MAKRQATKPHPWFEMALEFGKRTGGYFAVAYGTPEWSAWADYFHGIGFVPATFPRDDSGRPFTTPCRWPNMLDAPLPELERRHVAHPAAPKPEPPPRRKYVGMYANLYVGHDRPGYAAMCERAKTADWTDWCTYKDHPKYGFGIMVPLNWYQDWRGGRVSFVRPEMTPQQILDRYTAEAQQQHSETAE